MYNPRKKIEPYIDRGALIDWLHQIDYGNYVIEKIRNELLINSPRVQTLQNDDETDENSMDSR